MFFSAAHREKLGALLFFMRQKKYLIKKKEGKKKRKKGRRSLKAAILFAFTHICRGIWEHTLTVQELNVLVTVSLGDCGETPVHIANQDLQNKMLDFVLAL